MAEPQNPQGPPDAPEGYMSAEEIHQSLQQNTEETEPQPEEQHPVRRFFDQLIHGTNPGHPLDRALDVGRSAARGVANMANETVKTLGEGEAYAFRKTGLGGDEFNQEYDAAGGAEGYTNKKLAESKVPLQIPTDRLLGKRSDDMLAGFAEDTAQFMSSFALGDVAAGGQLGELKGLAGLGTRIVRGAVTEATAFDPHSGSMAGLIAKIPLAPVRAIGQAMMEKPGDSTLTVRFKRAASGAIPAVFVDGIVEGLEHIRAAKVVAEGATGAEKAAAEATMEKSAKTLNEIAQGTYTPEGAHVAARPNEDGTWQLHPVSPMAQEAMAAAPAEEKAAAAAVEGEEKPAESAPQPVVFKDRAEAEQQAESINNAINERLQAARNVNGITTEQANELRGTVNKLLTEPTPENLQALVDGSHFNFSYYNEPDQILTMIEGVSDVFHKELDAAQKAGTSVDKTFELTQQLLGRIPEADQGPALSDLLKQGGGPVPRSVVQGAADLVMRKYATKAAQLLSVIEQRPHDVVSMLEGRKAASTLVELQRALAGDVSETGRALRMTQERQAFADRIRSENGGELKLPAADTPSRATFTEPAGKDVAGMQQRPVRQPLDLSDEEAKTVLRVARLADGDVTALYGVGKTGSVIKEGGTLRAALEVGINGMLSGPVTASTVHIMGTLNTYYHAVTKLLGSAMVGSGAGMREAVDYMASLELHSMDNLKIARMAGIEGRSVINPTNVHEIIGSHLLPDNASQFAKNAADVAGNAVRAPGKLLTASEEFTRVSAYRAEVYSKSLRYWRAQGLDGGDLARQVAKDIDSAFDSKGVATLPAALARADALTMRNPLKPGSIGDAINKLSNSGFVMKTIMPFVKTSVNMFNWQLDRTPGINLLRKGARDILFGDDKEAAAQLWLQSGVSVGLGWFAVSKAAAGELTGRGTSNPALRPLWNKDNKPYSIKINGSWYSYNRGDPLMQMVSAAADAYTILHEVENEPKYQGKASDMLAATLAGMAASLGDKSYSRNATNFLEAWSGGKSELLKKWMLGEAGSMVPYSNMMRQTNNDPYMREVNGLQDELFSIIPGLSQTLPAKYDPFGNPVSRSMSLFPFKNMGKAQPDVASELLKLHKAFAPINRKMFMGMPIDITDRKKFSDGPDGLSPYERMNNLMANPDHGESLEDKLRDLVTTSHYQNMSPGSIEYPGGARWNAAAERFTEAQHRAAAQVLKEYPSLKEEVMRQRRIKGESLRHGQDGADAAAAR